MTKCLKETANEQKSAEKNSAPLGESLTKFQCYHGPTSRKRMNKLLPAGRPQIVSLVPLR
jgi:hypothetical protein